MSIYIKGIEMPIFEHQSWDIRKGADGKWYMVDTNAETSDGAWHEMIPIPSHGRLIDADKFERIKYEIPIKPANYSRGFDEGVKFVQKLIMDAPTIIPADKEEHDE